MANVLGIDLAQVARTLDGTEAVHPSAGQHRVDPRSTEFGRELYSTMVRNARAERTPRTEVAAARTPLSGAQAASALRTAYSRLFGSPPSDETLSVLVAQWAHETGGGASMLNYNFGGLKGTSPSGLTTAYTTHEGSGVDARKIVAHFRAYETAADGAADYLRLLSQRFPKALEAAQHGDGAEFVHALKGAGYFTDSETSYTRSVCALAERARTHGYDAIGRAPRTGTVDAYAVLSASAARGGSVRAEESVNHATAVPWPAKVGDHLGSGPELSEAASGRAIDLSAMHDELARAALRIAAGDNRTDES